MSASAVQEDKYDVVETIGRGSFGTIKKVRRRSDGKVMVRKEISYMKMSIKERDQLHAEFSILNSLRHPNIVEYYHREHIKASQDLHMYMEYCGGGDLAVLIKKLRHSNQYADEQFVWTIFAQLIAALYRCHYGVDAPEVGNSVFSNAQPKTGGLRPKTQVMILHRDLKPDNVFLGEDNSVKLGDFGLSKLMSSHDFASTYVGTPYYMSPEICNAERYTLHSDIWALGCIMYELCSRKVPFNGNSHLELIRRIKEATPDPLPDCYSTGLKETIKSCLKYQPLKRPDAKQLMEIPYIKLIRKEREFVEIGKLLKAKEQRLDQRTHELETRSQQLANELAKKELIRKEVEQNVRLEWEVKARLEIDRQVAIEKTRLKERFDFEVQSRVSQVRSQLSSIASTLPTSPMSPRPESAPPIVSPQDVASTDLSSLSLESPLQNRPKLHPPRGKRTPFGRAKTQFDSPADITMAEPSPMSIACLSLSPRRTAEAVPLQTGKNIFAAAAAQTQMKMRSNLPSPPSSREPTILDEAEEDSDELPELPSPSRVPTANNPFKSRPPLLRQKTAPTRPNVQTARPSIFGSKATTSSARLPTAPSPPSAGMTKPPGAGGSPRRNVNEGGDAMLKDIIQRNMNNKGKTLVELAQARVLDRKERKKTCALGEENSDEPQGQYVARKEARTDVPVWDPEEGDMPSPFLTRTKRMVV